MIAGMEAVVVVRHSAVVEDAKVVDVGKTYT